MKRTKLIDRILPDYTRGEEIFNMVSHIVGGAFAIAALVLCVVKAALGANTWGLVSGAIYGSTMIILYTMSSIYHGLVTDISKKVFQVIDHCAVFLLIAGTYTPITLCAMRPNSPVAGWVVFGIIWGAAAVGIVFNAIDLKGFRVFSMICYLGMGWCVIFAFKYVNAVLPLSAIVLLFVGGFFYTVGAILYGVGKKKRYMHSVFHLFVLMGSIAHFFMILLYIM